jgi:hypothetical protein
VRENEDECRQAADDSDEEAHVPILRRPDEARMQIVLGNR